MGQNNVMVRIVVVVWATVTVMTASVAECMVKGLGHLDHVRSYGVREVVSSIPDRGNIVG